MDSFSRQKRFVDLGEARVAYYEEGHGQPLLLLHGCPFSSFIWRKVIPPLAAEHRCLAPDLLGLGDTETEPDADWSLPAQARMVVAFLDALGIGRAHVVGHDHGGAIAQLLAARHADRVDRLVLSNAEAYDNWPSPHERPFLRLSQAPLVGRLGAWALSKRPATWLALATGRAVKHPRVLDPELLSGYVRANLGDSHRRAKWRRFLRFQLDPANNRETLKLLDGLRRFDQPTLLLWAEDDPHVGPEWAEKLLGDIAGRSQLELVSDSGHLLMEERPGEVAAAIGRFLLADTPTPAMGGLREI